ncbi:hypothetical protein [uncultured Methylobacterium sp.]|uniref:hypothetical protein n=1 Tax=uncultured Methylobacterium sp. TaxID=157278 RepID=UPI0035CA9168
MLPSKTLPDAEFLLLGDSHALAIRDAASSRAVPIVGGMLEGGRNLNIAFHRRAGQDVVFDDPRVDVLYRDHLASLGIDRIGDLTIPLLCTVGMNIHYLSGMGFWDGLTLVDRPDARFLSYAALTETVRALISGALDFYGDVASMGLRTFSVLPPRRTPNTSTNSRPDFFLALEDIVGELVEQAGATVIDHRSVSLDDAGDLKAEFRHPNSSDDVHGSEAFGGLILSEMLERIHPSPR